MANIVLLVALACATIANAQILTGTTTASEKRLADCTIESRSLGDCNIISYGIRVGIWLAPGIVIGVLILLSCPLYCLFKYCCNCCGGRTQTPNFCCPNMKYPARYSRGDLLRPKVIALLVVLVSVGSFIWGYISTADLQTGLDKTVAAVVGIPTVLDKKIEDIDERLTVKTYSAANDAEGTNNVFAPSDARKSAVKLRNDFKSLIGDQMGVVNGYLQYASVAGFLLFAVPLVLQIVGLLSALVNIRSFVPMMLLWFSMLFGALLWTAHGCFSGLSLLIGDVCTEVHGVVNSQANVVAPVISCKDSMFTEFRSNFKLLEVKQAEDACNSLNLYCYIASDTPEANIGKDHVYECPSVSCSGMTFAVLSELQRTSYKIHNNVANHPNAIDQGKTCENTAFRDSCYLARCAENCNVNGALSSFGKQSKELSYQVNAARTVSQSIDTIGAEYSTCDAVLSGIAAPFDAPCYKLTDSLVAMRQASGIHGLAALASIFVLGWGAKRFMKLDKANKIIDDTRPAKDDDAS